MIFSDTFDAMGTRVDVLAEAQHPPTAAFAAVRVLFERQESALSRFRPASALLRLNAGEMVHNRMLAAACALALRAHEFTGGIFNPMVLPALASAGYDRSFETVAGGEPRAQAVPDPRDILAIDGDAVQLSQGALDLGGIAKGWTVDLAVELLTGDFSGVMVNAGGDLRVAGSEPGHDGWLVGIETPDGDLTWAGDVPDALATSTTMKRMWHTASGGTAHHLIDPRTGLPAATIRRQVSVAGPLAWEAECWAKAILIGGSTMSREAGVAGYRVIDMQQSHPGRVQARA